MGPTVSLAIRLNDGPVGGPCLGQRGIVKVESFAQRKQQSPQATDLDAALHLESRRREKCFHENQCMHAACFLRPERWTVDESGNESILPGWGLEAPALSENLIRRMPQMAATSNRRTQQLSEAELRDSAGKLWHVS